MPKWQRWKNVMKCYPFEEKRLLKWQPPFIVQPKYDGIRCRAVPLENGEFLLLSSEENIIYSVPHVVSALKALQVDVELDGELYCHDISFEQITSITSRTVNLHNDYKNIQFHIFDCVNEQPQAERLLFTNKLHGLSDTIQVAPFWACENLGDIMRVYDKILNLGYEGIIVRHFAAPYERKRSTMVMKFKPKKEDLYEITGGIEEVSISGEPKRTLGALVIQSGDGNTFKVGTGFTQSQRHTLWQGLQSIKGKMVRISYQHLTDKKVPRFPVFMEVVENEKDS